MKSRKNLYIYGIVLLIVAIADVLMLVLDLVQDEFAFVTSEDKLVEKVTNVLLVVFACCISLSILVEGYLGVKGICESKNPTNAKAHIVIAKIIAVVNVVFAVIMFIGFFSTDDLWGDILTFAICAVDAAVMFGYVKEAKAVRLEK